MKTLLPSGYHVEVDQVAENDWYDILQEFEDASFYQTWAYGAVRWGRDNLSHLVLKRDDTVVAAAQVRIVKLPIVPAGIAYVRWGGFWQRNGEYSSPHVFRYMLRAIREEYAVHRKLYLRMIPNILDMNAQLFVDILQQEGFRQTYFAEVGRTINMDLNYSLKDIRAGMQSRWRNYLKRSEKSDLKIIEASADELYDIFVKMYEQMHHDKGLKSRGSYLLHWKMMEWLKERGYRWYDLGGIDPINVPGTAQFKYGMAGKTGLDIKPIGQFDLCSSFSSGLFVPLLDKLRNVSRHLQELRAHL